MARLDHEHGIMDDNDNDMNNDSNYDDSNEVDSNADEATDVAEEMGTDEVEDIGDDEIKIDEAGAFENTPPGPVLTQQGLVRDPYATFGGVISGIAHRYGWDVSLTRLGFLATVFLTGGTALLLYLIAWLIVPRATYWPPNGRVRSGGLSTREIGFGLAAVGVLVFLAVGTGGFGKALVPLALVGGGVWLLLQEPREELAANELNAPMAMVGGPTPTSVATQPTVGFPPAPLGAPVPPRRRRRRWLVGILATLLVGLLAIVALVIGLVVAAENGAIDIDGGNSIQLTPTLISDLPIEINEDAAEVEIDLTNLSSADFEGASTPAVVDVRVDVGSVRVIVPADLAVNVDAEVSIGSVMVDGQQDSGFGSQRRLADDDPDVDIEIDLGVGEVVVERLSASQTSIDRS